jgi:hypothetical protein
VAAKTISEHVGDVFAAPASSYAAGKYALILVAGDNRDLDGVAAVAGGLGGVAGAQ